MFGSDEQIVHYPKSFSGMYFQLKVDKCSEIENFFEQNTIQKIIDIQFKTTKQEIKKYLVIFSFGFFIPYIYNSLSLN